MKEGARRNARRGRIKTARRREGEEEEDSEGEIMSYCEKSFLPLFASQYLGSVDATVPDIDLLGRNQHPQNRFLIEIERKIEIFPICVLASILFFLFLGKEKNKESKLKRVRGVRERGGGGGGQSGFHSTSHYWRR